jgi:hypothetical protein
MDVEEIPVLKVCCKKREPHPLVERHLTDRHLADSVSKELCQHIIVVLTKRWVGLTFVDRVTRRFGKKNAHFLKSSPNNPNNVKIHTMFLNRLYF